MRRIVNLAVFAAILYFGYTQALPWLKAKRASESQATAGVAQATACLGAVENAAWSLSDEAIPAAAGPQVDRVAWGGILLRVGSQLAKADNACDCPSDACRTAALAAQEARRLLNALNSAVQTGDPAAARRAASRETEVSALLKQAQAQAR